MEIANRRSFLRNLAGLVTAPAIVRASSLMSIVPIPYEIPILDQWAKIGRLIIQLETYENGEIKMTSGPIIWQT